jgi:class 3 adenylate cyclase
MDKIRILTQKRDLDLSRSNNSLHTFFIGDEAGADETGIINHAIIKADLRGSTRITEQLVKRGLNPATHFSLNFFDPINKLLDSFGAEKVFVEGDAVILSIMELAEKKGDWMCVSRACGLSRKIIEVMDNQNSKNISNGLPALEMGIGIAFSNGPPAFLYDGDHRIMISSAINRASQLSNCSAMLRNDQMDTLTGGRGLRVVAADEEKMEKIADDKLLRYNVNGIELDAPAFFKLQKELSLMKVSGTEQDSRYFMGRYPDSQGTIHTLVLRESLVRIWRHNCLQEEDKRGRRYYEVVSNLIKINTATKLLNGQKASAPAPQESLTELLEMSDD